MWEISYVNYPNCLYIQTLLLLAGLYIRDKWTIDLGRGLPSLSAILVIYFSEISQSYRIFKLFYSFSFQSLNCSHQTFFFLGHSTPAYFRLLFNLNIFISFFFICPLFISFKFTHQPWFSFLHLSLFSFPPPHTGTNNTLTCLEDGLWSFPEALCELRCPAPPPVPNAVLQTKRCNETGLKVGTLCKYKCKPGYHVTNKPKR